MQPFQQDRTAWVSRCILSVLFLLTLGAMVRQGMLDEMEPLFMLLNMLIVAMPLLIFFFAIGLLAEALEQHLLAHRLTRRTGVLLCWTPRIAMLVFALFVSLFALDIFGQGYTLWETVVGLTMHLIPTFFLLAVVALAWRWPLVGGVAALLVAGGFLLQFGSGWADRGRDAVPGRLVATRRSRRWCGRRAVHTISGNYFSTAV